MVHSIKRAVKFFKRPSFPVDEPALVTESVKTDPDVKTDPGVEFDTDVKTDPDVKSEVSGEPSSSSRTNLYDYSTIEKSSIAPGAKKTIENPGNVPEKEDENTTIFECSWVGFIIKILKNTW